MLVLLVDVWRRIDGGRHWKVVGHWVHQTELRRFVDTLRLLKPHGCMIFTASGSTFGTLLARKAIGCVKVGTRPLPRWFAKLARYPIDTVQIERNAATTLRLTTIAPDLGVSTVLARGS